MVISEKLQIGFGATLISLTVPIMILNIFGGIVSGIWLAILGEWVEIIRGIGFIVVSGFLISFVLMPGLLFAGPAVIAMERGKKILGVFLGFLGVLYTYALMTIWCIWIMWLFVSSATESSIIPLLLWSYGVALAPWMWLAQKDQQGGGNEFSMLATFLAQISYIVAMIMFFLNVTLGTIAITFGVIMLIAAILQMTIAFGGEIRKSFSKEEVKEARRILEEENNKWVLGGFELVKSNIEKSILSHTQQFIDVIRKGRPVREYIYAAIANISGDMVESGQYHIRRGVFNPMGPGEDLLKIFDSAIDELVILGDLDKEYAQEQKQEIRKSIRDAG
ncbi:MAG TPA: hypothetical protein VMY06_00025 [Sedimentisphaerales bacterium]|nr:hypothetical protein [Sedimentisphaerales bacterium]